MGTSIFRKKITRPFYGWAIVFAAFLIQTVTGGVGSTISAFFLIPMSQALGVGRTAISIGISSRSVASDISSPVIGPILDKHGPRMLLVIGALLSGFAVMALGGVTQYWQYITLSVIVGLVGSAGLGMLIPTTTVSRWFVHRRGRAIAISTAGISVGVALFGPIAQGLISSIGWRWAWVFLGASIWIMVIPVSLAFMKRSPEDMGLMPDGDESRSHSLQTTSPKPENEAVWTLSMAAHTRSLWMLLVAYSLGGTAFSGIQVHQVPAILDRFTPLLAAETVFLFGVTSTISKLIFGFISERIAVQHLIIVCFTGCGLSVLFLSQGSSSEMILAFGVSYGLIRGGYSTLQSIVWAEYFGRSYLGTIRGVFQPVNILSMAAGPLIAGILFDVFNDYNFAFSLFTLLYLLAAGVMLLAPPPKLPSGSVPLQTSFQ